MKDNNTESQLFEKWTAKPPTKKELASYFKTFLNNPLNLLIIVMASIFSGEALITYIFSFLPPLSVFEEAVYDALLLTLITFPILYLFVLKPLQVHITEYELAEEKYRSLLASTEDSIYLLDRNYKYLFMNDWHRSRLGLSGDEYLGRSYSEFHSDERTRWFVEKANEVFNKGAAVRYEYKSRRDGKYYLVTLSPVKKSDGTTAALTVVSKDINELKKAEQL